jgi:hypothetical protein
MNTWDTRWLEEMTTNKLEILTGIRYMDDIRAFLFGIREGWRWWEGRLCYCEEWRQEDQRDGKSATRRTADIILAIMNTIMPFLEFTMEIHEDFLEMKLPTLDVKIWVVNGNRIEFDFFEKPMNPNTVLHAKTAQSESTKFSSLSQEIVRRMLHTSSRLPLSHGMENLEKFSQKMINSGHKQSYVKKVMISGILKFKRKLRKSLLPRTHKEYKPLHLGTKYNTLGRWKQKMLARNNWYEDKTGEKEGTGLKDEKRKKT